MIGGLLFLCVGMLILASPWILEGPMSRESAWLRGLLGGLFVFIGSLALLLKATGTSVTRTDDVLGILGLASFSLPATFILPGYYYLFLTRPNFLYSSEVTAFPRDHLIMGCVFTGLGIICNAGLVLIIRFVKLRRVRSR